MKLVKFRIQHFRSIRDTGWCPFSHDSVSVLIGQNESGKSSILSALETILGRETISDDDLRIGGTMPIVSLDVETSYEEIRAVLDDDTSAESQLIALEKYTKKVKGRFKYSLTWSLSIDQEKRSYKTTRSIEDSDLVEVLGRSWAARSAQLIIRPEDFTGQEPESGDDDEQAEDETKPKLSAAELIELKPIDVANAIRWASPNAVLFKEESGLLPDAIDINIKVTKYQLVGHGADAARNFLKIAGIELDKLVTSDPRSRENILQRGNEKVTDDFATFWSQTIGKKDKLFLRCALEHHSASSPEAGKPYLTFWVSDGQNHLYPKQRSTGVRWFISFYLQLKASDVEGSDTFFLLDEPGANLHSRAQTDVLNLINKLGTNRQIAYSTHSPQMIEYDKLYRVLAIQREGDAHDTPTVVIHAHHLGGASRDTLSPILNAIGSDFFHQEVIKRTNNVILEEMSGFYYMSAVWKLCDEDQPAHFIAATGVNNVEMLSNMFLGWGLGFVIVVDNDSQGRSVFNSLKRHMFADSDEAANKQMFKINGKGIEDIFSPNDFKTLVLCEPAARFSSPNSEYMKNAKVSKVVLAYQMWIKVSKGDITLSDFDAETQKNFSDLVREIKARLN